MGMQGNVIILKNVMVSILKTTPRDDFGQLFYFISFVQIRVKREKSSVKCPEYRFNIVFAWSSLAEDQSESLPLKYQCFLSFSNFPPRSAFTHYIVPKNDFIYNSDFQYHLYVDDTQTHMSRHDLSVEHLTHVFIFLQKISAMEHLGDSVSKASDS